MQVFRIRISPTRPFSPSSPQPELRRRRRRMARRLRPSASWSVRTAGSPPRRRRLPRQRPTPPQKQVGEDGALGAGAAAAVETLNSPWWCRKANLTFEYHRVSTDRDDRDSSFRLSLFQSPSSFLSSRPSSGKTGRDRPFNAFPPTLVFHHHRSLFYPPSLSRLSWVFLSLRGD